MGRWAWRLALVPLAWLLAWPGEASTLPTADVPMRPRLGLGLGWGLQGLPTLAAAWEHPVGNEATLGLTGAGGVAGLEVWSLRVARQLVRGDAAGPGIAVVGAVWGRGRGPAWPAVGFAMAFAPRPELTLRLALGQTLPLTEPPPGAWGFLGQAPCFGVEAAWRLTPGCTVTVGQTGHGEVVGIRVEL